MPSSTVKYTKQTTATDVSVVYAFDSLTVVNNVANTGIYITIVPDPIEIASTTITAGVSASNQSTITTTVTGAFAAVPVDSIITLKTGSEGSAVLPANSKVISKPNNQTLVIDKDGNTVTSSTGTGTTTIISTAPSGNRALLKLNIDLAGLGTASYSPKITAYFYKGDVTYANATANNATSTEVITKAINMESFLLASGVGKVDSNSLDVSA